MLVLHHKTPAMPHICNARLLKLALYACMCFENYYPKRKLGEGVLSGKVNLGGVRRKRNEIWSNAAYACTEFSDD